MRNKIREINLETKEYPRLLAEIPGPPKRLFVVGDMDIRAPSVAIVGTRKAGALGLIIAEQIAEGLARSGLTIVSGLAMGVDSAAHRGALKGGGKTIAVLGSGITDIYPKQNTGLAEKILETGGALISEYYDSVETHVGSFPARNRIISGLSVATVVVEAPEKSGALITASRAAEQGRTVFVVPGPVNNRNYKGSHALIRDGGTLASSAEDILEDLGLLNSVEITESKNKTKKNILENLQNYDKTIVEAILKIGRPTDADEIIELTKLSPQIVGASLAVLTIENIVAEKTGKYTIID
ncbi:MAG: DNA-protecting protein DprA [Candidatus Colwellbacteria bacterium]|nr:DNA-protecting protein DprA [Candidatus Colwellbacteria bacterium]